MPRDHYGSLNLHEFPVLQLVLEIIAGDAASPSEGRIWYDSTAQTIKFQRNGAVVDLRSRATHTGTQTAATISDFAAAVQAIRWASMLAPNAAVDMNGQQFANLGQASANGQAVEWGQFQTALSNIQVGMDFKEHVEIVALANVNTASPGATINGRTMVAGDRVLLTAQSTASQNGLWTWNGAATAMTRPADSPQGNSTGAIVAGTIVEGYDGTARRLFMQTATGTGTNGAIAIGTDPQTWTNPFASATYSAGYGITIVGGTKIAFVPGLGMAATGADGASAGIDPAVVPRKFPTTGPAAVPTSTAAPVTVGAADSGGAGLRAITVTHGLNNTAPLLILRQGSAGADPGQQVDTDNKPAGGTDANNLVFLLPNDYVANQFQYLILG